MVLTRTLGHAGPCPAEQPGQPAAAQEPGPLTPARLLDGVHIIVPGVPSFQLPVCVGVRKWQAQDSNLGSCFYSQKLGTEVPAGPWEGLSNEIASLGNWGMVTKDVIVGPPGREDPIRKVC